MGQVRHGSATTTHAVRAAIQRSQASLTALAVNAIKGAASNRDRTSLTKDPDVLLTFLSYVRRTLDPFANRQPNRKCLRHRIVRAKRTFSQKTAKLMVFALIAAESRKWLRPKGRNQLPKVIESIKFNGGIKVIDANETCAA